MPSGLQPTVKSALVVSALTVGMVAFGLGNPWRGGFAVQLWPWGMARSVADAGVSAGTWTVMCEDELDGCLRRARALCGPAFSYEDTSDGSSAYAAIQTPANMKSPGVSWSMNRRIEVECDAG